MSTEDNLDGSNFSERAHHLIPGGSHTYSRGDDQLPANAPAGFDRGKGARVWAVDGKQYVDWGMGINNVLIGHAEDIIDDASISAIRRGQAFSRPTPLEVELAAEIIALFPSMEMAKFCKSGSDANTAAVRLARAITGRDLVAYDAAAPFLSIHDWFIGKTEVNAGVPHAVRQLSVAFTYSDIESVRTLFQEHPGKIAAVVMEVCRDVRPAPDFLEEVRRLCDENGTLLVFDEVVTAFRYGINGAYSLFGVTPDLISLGKGMGNGYSVSALVGKRQFMERGGITHRKERVFFLSTTNGPEQSALAAGLATIRFYQEHDVIAHLYEAGQALIEGINDVANRHGIAGFVLAAGDFSCRPMLLFRGSDEKPSLEFRTLFLQEMMERQVFIPWVCPSFRHGQSELAQTLEAADGACAVYSRALEKGSVGGFLKGPVVKPVFRKFN